MRKEYKTRYDMLNRPRKRLKGSAGTVSKEEGGIICILLTLKREFKRKSESKIIKVEMIQSYQQIKHIYFITKVAKIPK